MKDAWRIRAFPAHGRQHLRRQQLAGRPRPLAALLQLGHRRRYDARRPVRGIRRDGFVTERKPVHPSDRLATIYYSLGIDPEMEIRNHLNQPRELVKGKIVTDLFA